MATKAMSYSLAISVIGVVYLVHSSYILFKWFRGTRYPNSCFSPSELKTFLNRIQITEPYCAIKVNGGETFPPARTNLTKDFVPHLWTEFTESIDVVGARKSRIETAANISDVLEELLRKNKVFIIDIGVEVNPEDNQSLKNTQYFASRVLDTASAKFPNTSSAEFTIQIPTISQEIVSTKIPLEDGSLKVTDENNLSKLNGPKLAAIVHRELDLPAFWYFMWKYKQLVVAASVVFPPLGIFFQHLLESISPRHNLDLNIKYSFVPQTDPPYQLDKTVPDIDFSEPQKVTILMPSERFLVPRDSLSRIITGDIDWRQNRHLYRTPSTESSPPILTPHTSNMAALMEHSEEYRRSRTSTSSDTNLKDMAGDSPPSYTAVFISETEGLTPPPDYSNLRGGGTASAAANSSQGPAEPLLRTKFF